MPVDGRLPGRATSRWMDEGGPLKIGRLVPVSDGAYRFQSGDDIAVDVHRGRRIVATIGPSVSSANLDHFLADQILPRVISDQGQLVVHAGAVRVGDAAILLMGASGRGKSTLSASFARSGLALMGDDAMVVSWDTDRPLAKPVYPSLRLLPDSIDALFDERPETSDIASYTPKQRIELPLGEREPVEPVPIKALFHIGAPTSDDAVDVRPMSVAETCMAIVQNSFAFDPSDTVRARDRLAQASKLAGQTSAFEVCYPRDYGRLPDVRQAILESLDQCA